MPHKALISVLAVMERVQPSSQAGRSATTSEREFDWNEADALTASEGMNR